MDETNNKNIFIQTFTKTFNKLPTAVCFSSLPEQDCGKVFVVFVILPAERNKD